MKSTISKEIQKERSRRKYHIYLNQFLAWVTKGKFILGEEISAIGIKPIGDRILTKNEVIKIWQVVRFPYDFNYELISVLQQNMKERYPEVDLVFQLINEPIYLNIENQGFVSQRQNAAQNYERVHSVFDSLSETDKVMGIKHTMGNGMRLSFGKENVEKQKQIWDSYNIAADAVTSSKAINYTNFYIYAHAPNNKVMNKFVPAFRAVLLKMELAFRQVNNVLNNFLENYGPASFIGSDVKAYPQTFLLRDNLTYLLPTDSEGLVNEEGILMGVNVNNGFPFLLEFFKSGQGQTCMLCAKSGWGKTLTAFKMVLGLLGADVHVSVTDLKGSEWNKIGTYTNYLEISLGGEQPRAVNTLRLDDMQAAKDDCIYIYNDAIEATVKILSLMSEVSSHPNKGDLEKAFRTSINTLYNQHGVVKENPDTFKYTKHLKYEDILPILAQIENGTETMPEEVKKICNIARFRCEATLKESGSLSEAFRNEITVQEILDVPLVIYSLNKNTDSDLTIAETIAIFMAEYLSMKKHHFRKRKDKHSAIYAEEVQRYKEAGAIVEWLSSQTTGARSQNVMIVFLLNSLSKLNGQSFAPIKSNITTAMFGLLAEQDINMVKDDFGYNDLYDDLVEIAAAPDDYRNVFAISYNTGHQHGNALFRAMLPSKMSKALATRTIRE